MLGSILTKFFKAIRVLGGESIAYSTFNVVQHRVVIVSDARKVALGGRLP